jgi:hypothetical protein
VSRELSHIRSVIVRNKEVSAPAAAEYERDPGGKEAVVAGDLLHYEVGEPVRRLPGLARRGLVRPAEYGTLLPYVEELNGVLNFPPLVWYCPAIK